MIKTGVDQFGRVEVSRKDREALTTEWNAEHGQPMNSGHIIVRDQWVAREAIKRLRAACRQCEHPKHSGQCSHPTGCWCDHVTAAGREG